MKRAKPCKRWGIYDADGNLVITCRGPAKHMNAWNEFTQRVLVTPIPKKRRKK
jgi:hypothetical protein